MSVRDAMRKAMYDRLLTQFPAEYGSSIPVFLENQKFEQPRDTPYIITFFKYGKSRRASIGTASRFNRHEGFLVADCVVPEKSGTAAMWKIADAVSNTFEAATFTLEDGSAVTIHVPSVYSSGKMQDGFSFGTVMVPFMIDEKGRR